MADFCKQCTIEYFGLDVSDFEGITPQKAWKNGKAALVLCEGCGAIQVDPEGNCISKDCDKEHNY